MNRGVLPVQPIVVAGNRNPGGSFFPHHQLIPATPPPPPPTATTVQQATSTNSSWHGEFIKYYQDQQQQLLTADQSWSQLLLGSGMMGSDQLEKKLHENFEEAAASNNYNLVYGHGGASNSDSNNWSQMISSCVANSLSSSNNNNNMLNFSSNNPHSSSISSSSEYCKSSTITTGGVAYKKARVLQPSNSTQLQATFKVRKEKLGDRITALHQIVSPFGKTDTASVLLEAIGYIRFLQGQIEALSLPYMGDDEAGNMINNQHSVNQSLFPDDPGQLLNGHQYCTIKKRKGAPDHHHHYQGECDQLCNEDAIIGVKKDLRSRGLCLVPVSCTIMQVESSTGADYWTQAPSFQQNI